MFFYSFLHVDFKQSAVERRYLTSVVVIFEELTMCLGNLARVKLGQKSLLNCTKILGLGAH
jgi:hypothetical protein